jgi:hypothetical protein
MTESKKTTTNGTQIKTDYLSVLQGVTKLSLVEMCMSKSASVETDEFQNICGVLTHDARMNPVIRDSAINPTAKKIRVLFNSVSKEKNSLKDDAAFNAVISSLKTDEEKREVLSYIDLAQKQYEAYLVERKKKKGEHDVRYQKWSNLDGPVHVEEKKNNSTIKNSAEKVIVRYKVWKFPHKLSKKTEKTEDGPKVTYSWIPKLDKHTKQPIAEEKFYEPIWIDDPYQNKPTMSRYANYVSRLNPRFNTSFNHAASVVTDFFLRDIVSTAFNSLYSHVLTKGTTGNETLNVDHLKNEYGYFKFSGCVGLLNVMKYLFEQSQPGMKYKKPIDGMIKLIQEERAEQYKNVVALNITVSPHFKEFCSKALGEFLHMFGRQLYQSLLISKKKTYGEDLVVSVFLSDLTTYNEDVEYYKFHLDTDLKNCQLSKKDLKKMSKDELERVPKLIRVKLMSGMTAASEVEEHTEEDHTEEEHEEEDEAEAD